MGRYSVYMRARKCVVDKFVNDWITDQQINISFFFYLDFIENFIEKHKLQSLKRKDEY